MLRLRNLGAVAAAACALLAVPAAAQDSGLRIVVIEGEDSINIIEQGTAVPTLVEVRDRNDLPVAGASVLFLLGEGGTATLNAGVSQVALTTNALGQAAVTVNPVASGAVQLSVNATFQGQTAAAAIVQTNFATVAEAAAAGVGATGGAGGAGAGAGGAGAGGTGAAGAGAAGAGAAAGGLGTGAIVGIAGAAAGAAVGVGVATGGDDPPPDDGPPDEPPSASPPAAPSPPVLTPGDGQLSVRWTAPANNGAAIDDYDVRYRPSGGVWVDLPDAVKSTATMATITGLTNGTAYEVQVRAGNSAGDGPWSAGATGTPAAAVTPASPPSAPSAPTLRAGDGRLTASWTPPADNGAAIDDYDLRYRPSGGVWTELADAVKSTSTTATITGLTNGTAYEVQVRAGNSAGDGPWSAGATGTPVSSASVPSAPSAPTLRAGDGQLTASWTAPADNGAVIDDYDVRYRSSGGAWTALPDAVKSTSTTATITGLTNGTPYEVQVRAGNAVGDGPWSAGATGTPVPSASVPSAPPAPTLRAGDGQLTAIWTAPSDNGSPIDDYDVRYGTDGRTWTELPDAVKSVSTTATITGLTNGTAYVVQVRAGNAVGDGSWSESATATPVSDSSGDARDRAVLMEFYNATDGPNWVDNTNWNTNAPLNQWHGVSTGANGGVTRLMLERNGLRGSMPSSLGNLTNLEWLFLSDSQLSGPIPSSLGNLTNLDRLVLASDELSGPIPSSLGNLTNLVMLILVGDELSGPIPSSLGNLTNLVWLSLAGDELSGPIPSFLGDLTNLVWLYLASDELSGPIPSFLGDLTNLEELGLVGNQLNGPIPSSLGNLTSLELLILNNNQLSGPIPSSLGSLTNLRGLYLQDNQLSGSIPSSLGNLTNLQALFLEDNQLSGSIPSSLGNLTNLRGLYLQDNQLSGSIPSSLGDLAWLAELYLTGNRLSGSIPAALCKFDDTINPQQDGVILPCAESSAVGAVEVRLVPGDARLTVDWTVASDEGGAVVDDYDVRYRVDGEAGAWTELAGATQGKGTTATIGDLTNGTAYEVQVRAANPAGGGVWSAGATGTPVAAGGLSFGDARIEDQRWRQYAAIAPLVLPAARGGAGAVTYAVSPALPAGLVFDEASRTVSGAPSAARAAATYEYTATDAAGATAGLTFAVEVEMSDEEAALRRDALAAQGRALLSSVTGVIGERLRPRSEGSGPAGAGGRGSAARLGEALASLLGLPTGRGLSGAGAAGPGPSAGAAFAGGMGYAPASGGDGGRGALSALGSGSGPGMGGPSGSGSARGRGGLAGHGWAGGGGGLWGPGSAGGMGGLAGLGPAGGAGGLAGLGPAGGLGGLGGIGSFGGLGGRGSSGAGSPGALGGPSPLGRGGLGGALPGLGSGPSAFGAGAWDGGLWGQSFEAPLPVGGEGGGASGYTVWGAGDVQSFSGSPEAGRYSGDMRSLYVGADGRLGADWLAGAAVGRSWGSADYTAAVDGAVPGRLTTLLTGVYPYVRGALSAGLEVWAIGGYGRGSAADARAGELAGEPGDLTMTMGAAGLRRDVAEAGGVALAVVGGAGALSLSSSGGGLTVSGLGAGVHQGRVALEASRASGAVSPFVQVGGRYDGGDGETGAGLELVGGVRASTARVDLEARGRWLSVHTASGYSEYGAMARLSVKSRADGTGVRAALSPRWGLADELSLDGGGLLGGAGSSPLDRGGAWASSGRGRALSLDGEVGYGWRARRLRGVLSPLTSYRRTGFGGDLTQVGLSYQSSASLRGDVRMQFTLGREQWLDRGAGYRLALAVLSVF